MVSLNHMSLYRYGNKVINQSINKKLKLKHSLFVDKRGDVHEEIPQTTQELQANMYIGTIVSCIKGNHYQLVGLYFIPISNLWTDNFTVYVCEELPITIIPKSKYHPKYLFSL